MPVSHPSTATLITPEWRLSGEDRKKRSKSSECLHESKPKAASHLEGNPSKKIEVITKIHRGECLSNGVFISRNTEATCSAAHPSLEAPPDPLANLFLSSHYKKPRSPSAMSSSQACYSSRVPGRPHDFFCKGIWGLSYSGLISHRSTTSKPFEAKVWGRNITFILFYLPL